MLLTGYSWDEAEFAEVLRDSCTGKELKVSTWVILSSIGARVCEGWADLVEAQVRPRPKFTHVLGLPLSLFPSTSKLCVFLSLLLSIFQPFSFSLSLCQSAPICLLSVELFTLSLPRCFCPGSWSEHPRLQRAGGRVGYPEEWVTAGTHTESEETAGSDTSSLPPGIDLLHTSRKNPLREYFLKFITHHHHRFCQLCITLTWLLLYT